MHATNKERIGIIILSLVLYHKIWMTIAVGSALAVNGLVLL